MTKGDHRLKLARRIVFLMPVLLKMSPATGSPHSVSLIESLVTVIVSQAGNIVKQQILLLFIVRSLPKYLQKPKTSNKFLAKCQLTTYCGTNAGKNCMVGQNDGQYWKRKTKWLSVQIVEKIVKFRQILH